MTSNLHFTFPIEELAKAIAQKLKPEILTKVVDGTKDEIFLTRKETSLKLNISLPTLNSYTKRGIIIGYRVGARVLYRNSELETALSKINYSK